MTALISGAIAAPQAALAPSAHAAGCRAVLLARPYNSAAGADRIVDTLLQAVAAIAQSASPIQAKG